VILYLKDNRVQLIYISIVMQSLCHFFAVAKGLVLCMKHNQCIGCVYAPLFRSDVGRLNRGLKGGVSLFARSGA
jgi:hypothetical protein